MSDDERQIRIHGEVRMLLSNKGRDLDDETELLTSEFAPVEGAICKLPILREAI